MKYRLILAIIVGKVIQKLSRMVGNNGSALPGLVIERTYPSFLNQFLSDLPDGVVIVIGTNGKTTTTKIASSLLASRGKRVLTNETGSNFTRGVISSIISSYKVSDKSTQYDVAVFELDEAYAKIFVRHFKPQYVVALNVMRDQLDRFGELDTTMRLISSVLNEAAKGCVLYGNEPRLVEVAKLLETKVVFYGVSEKLRSLFPTDAELLSTEKQQYPDTPKFDIELRDYSGQRAIYAIDSRLYSPSLVLRGHYSYLNAAAALAVTRMVLPKVSTEDLIQALVKVKPAFGRNELLTVNDMQVEIVLVKNPGSFRQALIAEDSDALTMMAINDKYADGRDVSWLWDVDFTGYKSEVYVTSGIRATDMALRLKYDDIDCNNIEHDLKTALKLLLSANSTLPRRIFCTYTAMLKLRRILLKDLGGKET